MAAADLLAQLRDIHLPGPPGWWPPAPGWWGLFVMALLLLAAGVTLWVRYRRRTRVRRDGLRALANVEAEFLRAGDAAAACREISAILRTVAADRYPDVAVAGLVGEAWCDFLRDHSTGGTFDNAHAALLLWPFMATAPADAVPPFTAARAWITERRRPHV